MKSVFSFRKGLFYWFPVFPFLMYWAIAFLTYYLGPVSFQGLTTGGLVFVVACLSVFIISYVISLNVRSEVVLFDWSGSVVFYKLFKFSAVMAVIGSGLMILDRLINGAASFDVIVNEMYRVREEYSKNTSLLTTVSVVPYSFKWVLFSCLFFALKERIKIRKFFIFSVLFVVASDLLNMFFSANRGAIYEYFFYIIFYFIFVRRYSALRFFSLNRYTLLLFVLIICSFSYFFFVASSRTVASTLEYQGQKGSESIRWEFLDRNMSDLDKGAFLQLYKYFNHGLEYTDVIVQSSPILDFDFVALLGGRVISQIRRFDPSFTTSSDSLRRAALTQSGKSLYGWPSVFGIAASSLGIVGSVVFFTLIGFWTGRCFKNFLVSNSFPFFILIFSLYNCYLFSFDWFVRDFSFFTSLFVASFFLLVPKKSR